MKQRLVLTTTLVVIAILLVATALIPSTVSAAGPYSKTITVNSAQVPSSQTNFPVLISLVNDSDLAAHVARADGGDIYFTDSGNTTVYSHEIENYNNTTGTLVAWVNVSSISSSANTSIKMWYGVDSGTPRWDPTNVWDSNFKGVWHMAQINASDSTSNNNNGTVVNSTVASSLGLIDGADSFNNSYYSYIDCGNSSSLSFNASAAYTWTAWVNTTLAPGGGCGIIGKAVGSGYDIYLKQGGGIVIQAGTGGSGASQVAGSAVSYNVWHQTAITYNNQSVSIYLDGTLNASGSLSGMADNTLSHLFIGFRASHSNGTGIFNGSIDEVKYSTTIRSADWIRTEYNNQKNPGSFYTVSGETQAPTPSPTPTVSSTVSPTVSPTPSPTPTTSPTVLPTSTSTPTPTAAGGPGDVNDDGRINCLDITQCELCILYPVKYPKESYPGWDANEDGDGPNAGDVLAVEYRILGKWPPPH